ncbi:MAG: hypothetical protein UW28_C0008G0026, partial [Parcubacteria group bacterium GW2011_GWA2_44_13]
FQELQELRIKGHISFAAVCFSAADLAH